MRGSLKRSAVATMALLVVVWAVLPMALASAASKSDVGNGDESWYQQFKEPLAALPPGDPTCESPAGCNLAGNLTRDKVPQHPEGVLVVAANGGEPDAQTFFNFGELPLGAVVTGGTVTLPVATDEDARAVRPEAAKMIACMVTGFIPGGADGGSWQDRPAFDDGSCVPVEIDDTAETLTYTFSLDRFGKVWGTGTKPMQGVTLMVDPEVSAPSPNETWRAVFNSSRRAAQDPETYPPITSDVSYKVLKTGLGGGTDLPTDTGGFPAAEDTSSTGTTTSSGDFGTSSAPAGGTFDSGTAPADTGSISAPQSAEAPPVSEPQAAEEQPLAAAPQQPVPAAATGMSPAVWLLPLLAVAMAGALAWSLMQPVELVGEREGAVSKLMRNRRLAGSDTSTPA